MLTVQQVAERLNCCPSSVYRLIKARLLGHHRCPGIRVSEEQVTDYLKTTRRECVAASAPQIRTPRTALRHITLPSRGRD